MRGRERRQVREASQCRVAAVQAAQVKATTRVKGGCHRVGLD